MTASIYISYGDYRTASDIIRWIVDQIRTHPYYDTVLNAVFRTEIWWKLNWLFRQQFGIEKYAVTVDVTVDNGEKKNNSKLLQRIWM